MILSSRQRVFTADEAKQAAIQNEAVNQLSHFEKMQLLDTQREIADLIEEGRYNHHYTFLAEDTQIAMQKLGFTIERQDPNDDEDVKITWGM